MQVFRSEIKVGLLIVLSFVLFLIGIFIVSDIGSIWNKKKTLVLVFPYADGITRGSPVWYAGFEVGEVTEIRISQEIKDRIALTVRISPQARVRKDSRIDIRSLGMMGAKYVEISPGSPESPELGPNDVLEGQGAASLSEILETGQRVASRVLDLVQEANALVHEIRTEYPLKQVIDNANGLLVDARSRVKEIEPVVRKVNNFADSLTETGKNVKQASGEGGKELVALLQELRDTNKGLQKRLENVEAELTKTLGAASGVAGEAKSILTSNKDDIASLVKHLNETSRHIEALSEDLRAHPWKVVWKEEGTSDTAPGGTEQWREKGRIGPYGKK
jgi:phospholipid/cholesterol/gamma-HCH transport system substrate-binding protein